MQLPPADSPNPDYASARTTAEQPLAYRVVRGGVAVALSSYGVMVWGFIANLILTRLLEPNDFGLFALATFFFALFNLRSKIGVDHAFAQRSATTGDLIGTYLVLSVLTGILTLGLTIAAAPILSALGYAPIVSWLALALAVIGVSEALMGVAWILLDKHLLFARSSWLIVLAFPLSYLPAFILALNGAGVWSLVAQNAAYALMLLIGLWFLCRRHLPAIWKTCWFFRRDVALEFLRFGLPVGMATISGMLLYQFDSLLVGTFIGVVTLGYYDRAYRIAQWPHLLVSSLLTRVSFYAYAQLQQDVERLGKVVAMTLWLVTRSAVPLAIAIFISAPDLVILLWGERWLASAFFVRLLVVYSVLRPLLDDAGVFFIATGQPGRQTRILVVQAIVLMLTATPLTLAYGVIGTAIGVGFAFAVGFILTYYYIRQSILFSPRDMLTVPMVALGVTLLLYTLLTQMFDLNTLWVGVRAVMKFAFGGATYLVITCVLEPRITTENSRYVWRLLTAKS